ncbi:MAG TPA: DUF3482 domain-containing protein, partial [Anaeromyxobacteraceae bacterium]|nr:DUF3482 domain-containing protein [Anaeromyxobacteraceae bacterium]
MSDIPRFAVVGRVNKGKSSIVATLAEDDTVRVDARPGTTTEAREYPARVDGRTLFVLVDTPGFEDAPRVLAWLRARETTAAERPARVAEFVRAFEGTDEFVDERRLLAPILDGASVLYVVDGTKPYRPNYEAEMEILRWTGRPGMALVNRIGAGDHGEEWRRALGQYFNVVRDFDAFAVTFEERMSLLRAFRELRADWRAPVDEAIAALVAERRRRREAAAGELADLLAEELTHVEELAVDDPAELAARRGEVEAGFHDALRKIEARARRRVEGLYAHRAASFQETEILAPRLQQDLFAEETWTALGLRPGQLVAAGAIAGGVGGGVIDAAVGGASFMAGTLLGSAVGAGTALYGLGRRFAAIRPVGPGGIGALAGMARRYWSSAKRFRIGPHAAPNFPWVVLDRALLHFRAVAARTHARRGLIAVPDPAEAGIVATLSPEERRDLERTFRKLRRHAGDPPRELRDRLARKLEPLLARLDP